MNGSRIFCCALALSFVLCGTAKVGNTKEISPAEDYCREINDPSSGTEIVLRPGLYRGACKVGRGGKPGVPLLIRVLSLTHKPRIEYEGKSGNVLEIYAANVIIEGLDFGRHTAMLMRFGSFPVTTSPSRIAGLSKLAESRWLQIMPASKESSLSDTESPIQL